MTGLVFRLRAEVDPDVNEPLDRLLDEAADEIERLSNMPDRAALIEQCAKIADYPGFVEARDSDFDIGFNAAKAEIGKRIRALALK